MTLIDRMMMRLGMGAIMVKCYMALHMEKVSGSTHQQAIVILELGSLTSLKASAFISQLVLSNLLNSNLDYSTGSKRSIESK